jgi:hypothetical protein
MPAKINRPHGGLLHTIQGANMIRSYEALPLGSP